MAGASSVAYGIPAFPGAEGAGANAIGGRNGDVYRVTSLADTNTVGTLRYGINNTPAAGRTIVFDVGGTIHLNSSLTVNKSKITIAGQTAPGPGITLVGYTFQVAGSSSNPVSDVVVRHIRSRKGNLNSSEDAVGVLGGSGSGNEVYTSNVILDHISASWGEDEILSLTNHSSNVTVQYSVIAEGLDDAGHGYGSLLWPQISATYSLHHNLWANTRSRNPRTGSYYGQTLTADLRNNVVYNWSERAGYTGSSSDPNVEHTNLNFVGNYLVAGPATPSGSNSTRAFSVLSNSTAAIYQSGNKIDSNRDAVRNGTDTGWGMIHVSGGVLTQQAAPFAISAGVPVTTDSADAAYLKVLAFAGAAPGGNRDATDSRIVNQVKTAGGFVPTAPNAAEWAALINQAAVSRPAGWDTDADGMPSAWEEQFGFNPGLKDHHLVQWSGYTALEHYLYWLAPTIPGDASGDMKLGPDDYTLLDRGRVMGLSGWRNGDFTGDGIINAQDYMLLDQGVLAAGGFSTQMLAEREAAFGREYVATLTATVPEPATTAGVVLLSAGILGRARGSHKRF